MFDCVSSVCVCAHVSSRSRTHQLLLPPHFPSNSFVFANSSVFSADLSLEDAPHTQHFPDAGVFSHVELHREGHILLQHSALLLVPREETHLPNTHSHFPTFPIFDSAFDTSMTPL